MNLYFHNKCIRIVKLINFLLKDNCFTEFCFLSSLNMNQPWVAEPFLICLMGAFIEFCEDYMRYYITIAPTLGPHSSYVVLHLDLFKCFSQASGSPGFQSPLSSSEDQVGCRASPQESSLYSKHSAGFETQFALI